MKICHSAVSVKHRIIVFALVILSLLHSLNYASAQTPPNTNAANEAPKQLSDDVRVYVSVIDPGIVSDIFGRRVSQRFVAIQVTIANQNPDFQFLIHDVSLDLKGVFGKRFADNIEFAAIDACESCMKNCKELSRTKNGEATPEAAEERAEACKADCTRTCRLGKFELSSLELSLIRGVAEKGQGEDTRNKVLRYFRAVGTIAAGLIGVASFGPSFPKAVAVFNGPVINAYSELYPDYTINQMNRLSDSAYKSNTLVPKQQAKVLVAFIPQAIFLSRQERDMFMKDPTSLYPDYAPTPTPTPGVTSKGAPPALRKNTGGTVDFRKAVALVDGSFITEVENLPPLVTGVHIDPAQALEFLKDRPVVEGYITGQFLKGADIDLLDPPEGMSIALKGKADDGRLYFVIKSDRPVPRGTRINYRVFNNQGVQTISQSVSYMPPVPTLDNPDTPLTGTAGGPEVEIELSGKDFLTDITHLVIDDASGIAVKSESVSEDGRSLQASLDMKDAKEGVYKLKVANGTTQSNELQFAVKPKP